MTAFAVLHRPRTVGAARDSDTASDARSAKSCEQDGPETHEREGGHTRPWADCFILGAAIIADTLLWVDLRQLVCVGGCAVDFGVRR